MLNLGDLNLVLACGPVSVSDHSGTALLLFIIIYDLYERALNLVGT